MKKKIPYGIGDFETIRKDNYYYVDKTKIIKELEKHRYPFFIRPRRFGKSLLISILEDYYDIKKRGLRRTLQGVVDPREPDRRKKRLSRSQTGLFRDRDG